MSTEVKFQKRAPGLYGTGIKHDLSDRWQWLWSACCTEVEACVDRHTSSDGWHVRYVCEHGHFTDTLGEWYPTLGDAKARITATGRA